MGGIGRWVLAVASRENNMVDIKYMNSLSAL